MEMAAANPGDSQYGEKPRCPICLGKFKTPRELPCLHSFCQSCLEDYISSQAVKEQELKQFECPSCRTVVPVSREGKTFHSLSSLFPINTILQSIGDKDKEKVDRPCDCCLSDGVSAAANGFCVVCEEAMCEKCASVHQKQKATKEHSIVTIEELSNNPNNVIRFHKGFRCQEHAEEHIKFYCKDHMTACCASCFFVNHRNCGKVFDLSKDVSNLLLEIKPLQVLEEMKTIEDHLTNFEKRNDSYINSLESQVQEMTNKINEIRRKLNDILDDLERKVKSEGNLLYKQEATRKQEENRECQALLNAVRNSHVTLEMVMKHGSDTQIFLIAERMISQVKLYYEQMKEKFEEVVTVTLDLEEDSQIQCVLAHNSEIGRMISRKKRQRFPIARSEKPFNECQIARLDFVEIEKPDDKKPNYTGVTYLQDQVMLADIENKRILLVNSSYQYIDSFTLEDKPWDICVVDQQEVAVSFPFQKTLQFLSVTSGSIKPIRTVQTRYECWGVATAGKAKVVVSGDCNDKGKHYWSLINSSTGKEEICHQFDCQCRPSSTYITVNSSCTSVYVTVFMADSLYCFDMDGNRMYIYSIDSLKGPKGVATDRDDNVYVVGWLSNNIHQLKSDGAPIRIITEGIPRGSMAMCLNNSLDRILITNNTVSDSINIYAFTMKR